MLSLSGRDAERSEAERVYTVVFLCKKKTATEAAQAPVAV